LLKSDAPSLTTGAGKGEGPSPGANLDQRLVKLVYPLGGCVGSRSGAFGLAVSYQTASGLAKRPFAKHNDNSSSAAAASAAAAAAATAATCSLRRLRLLFCRSVALALGLSRPQLAELRLGLPFPARRTMVSPNCYSSTAPTDGRRYSRPYPPYFLPERRFHLASHDNRSVTMTGPPTESGDTPPRKRIAVAVGPGFLYALVFASAPSLRSLTQSRLIPRCLAPCCRG